MMTLPERGGEDDEAAGLVLDGVMGGGAVLEGYPLVKLIKLYYF